MPRVNNEHTAPKVKEITWVCSKCENTLESYSQTDGTCDKCGEVMKADVRYG